MLLRLNAFYLVIWLSAAIAALSVTITKTPITAKIREWVDDRSEFFGDLIHCPYCTSHWIAAVFVAVYQPNFTVRWRPLDLFVAWFVLVCLAALWTGAILSLQKPKANKEAEHGS